jgi:hypothetical protein
MTTALEDAVSDLTTQTTTLINVASSIFDDTSESIEAAVIVSENAAQVPLAQMATNLIDMQALLINLIASG